MYGRWDDRCALFVQLSMGWQMDEASESPDGDRGNLALAGYLVLVVLALIYFANQQSFASLIEGGTASPAARAEPGTNLVGSTDASEDAVATDDMTDPAVEEVDEVELVPEIDPENSPAPNVQSRPVETDSAPRPGFEGIDFDLRDMGRSRPAQTASANGTVELSKPLFAGGRQLGALPISIDGNAQVYVRKAALSGLLGGDASASGKLARLPDGDLISFRSLRDYGINLKYEPVSDRIVLQ